jgi:hypothetical protein
MTDKTLEEMNEELVKLMDDIEDVSKDKDIDGVEYSLHNKEFNGTNKKK